MADRIARVVLQAVVTQYRDAMKAASKDTEELGRKAKVTSAQTQQSMQTLGRGMMVGGAVVVAGFGAAAMASARFEKQMSGVKAVSNATAGEMERLSDAALKAGADTVFSASDAARAEAELAKAGIAVHDILGGALTGSLNLAAAGQLDLAEAATISAQAMNIFKLEGKDVSHIADVLAAGANKSAADVGQLGDALRQGGLVAAQTGLSLEETTGALAAFADNALIGSDAGTSLKTMLQRLTPQSDKAAELMDELGLTAYDAQGNFVGLEAYAGKLRKGLAGLSDEQKSTALTTIFGSDAVRAASVLYDQGAEGIADYTKAVNDQGAAGRMAATQMDNLAGDVEALTGSLETALIQSGSGANKVLRDLTQTATGAVNAFGDLPGPVQQGVTGLAALAGAAALAGGAVLVGTAQVAKFKTSLDTLGVSAEKSNRAVGMLSKGMKGLGYAGAALATLAVLDQLLDMATEAPKLGQLGEDLVDFAHNAQVAGELAKVGGDDFEELGKKITEARRNLAGTFGNVFSMGEIRQSRKDIEALDQTLASFVNNGYVETAAQAYDEMVAAAKRGGASQKDVDESFTQYQEALAGVRTNADLASPALDGLSGELREQAVASADAAKALRDQANANRALFDPVFAVQDALSKQVEAQKNVSKAAREHGAGSAEHKQSLADVLRATVDLEGALLGLAAGVEDGSVSFSQMNGQLEAYARAGLISASQVKELRKILDGTASKASMLTDMLGILNRTNANPTVTLNAAAALSTIAKLERRMLSVSSRGGPRIPFATGGFVSGPGSGTSDSIPARLSNGEFVVNASAAQRNRGLLEAINSHAPGFAAGGSVGTPPFNPRYGSLSQQASRLAAHGGSRESLDALIAAYDIYLAQLDKAAQRTKLLQDLGRAKTAEERASARQSLADFDKQAARDAQRAAANKVVDGMSAKATAAQKLADAQAQQAEIQDNMFSLGLISAKEEEKHLTKRMALVKKYSNAWMDLHRQREQVRAQQHQTALEGVTFTSAAAAAQWTQSRYGASDGKGGVQTGDIHLHGSRGTPQELRRELAWLTR